MKTYKAIVAHTSRFDNAEDAITSGEQLDIGFVTLDEAKHTHMGMRACGAVTRGDEDSATLYILIDEKWVDFLELENNLGLDKLLKKAHHIKTDC